MLAIFEDETLRVVAMGAAAIGAPAGALGVFAVLRRQSLVGDALSHAALPGVALAFLLTGLSSSPILMFGAVLTGWLAMGVVGLIHRRTRVPFDSALAGVLAVFLGLGLALAAWMQRRPGGAAQPRVERFLFGGSAAFLSWPDVYAALILGGFLLLVLIVAWRRLEIISFDPDYAIVLGYPTRIYDFLLTGMLAAAIVIGLQRVGATLMSALVVAPAVAARQCSDRLKWVVSLAGLFGGLSGLVGVWVSDALSNPSRMIPTGPAIVLCAGAFAGLAIVGRKGIDLSRQALARKGAES